MEAAEIAQELIRNSKPISRESCGLVANKNLELANGVWGSTNIQGAYVMLSLGEGTMVVGFDSSGISSWLELKFPDIFAPSVKLRSHEDPACLKAIDFYSIPGPSSFERKLSKNPYDVIKVVPALLRMIASLHSIGLSVPWNDIDITEGEKFWFLSRSDRLSISWTSFLGSEQGGSRKDDLRRLCKTLSMLSSIPDLPMWMRTVWDFDNYVRKLGTTESPDYESWITAFSKLDIVSVGDRFAALAPNDVFGACDYAQEDWTSWIARVPQDSAFAMWEGLHGSRLIAMITRITRNHDCRMTLVRIVNKMMMRISESTNPIDLAVLFHSVFKDWDASGFCQSSWDNFRPLLGPILDRMPFTWVVCPEQFVDDRSNLLIQLRRLIAAVDRLKIKAPLQSLASLLPALELPRMMTLARSSTPQFLKLASSLLRNSGLYFNEFQNFVNTVLPVDDAIRLCGFNKAYSAQLVDDALDLLTLAWVCDPPSTEAQLCALVEQFGFIRMGDPVSRPVSSFAKQGLVEVSLLANRDDVSPVCRQNAFGLTVNYVTNPGGFTREDETMSRIAVLELLPFLPTVEPLCRYHWTTGLSVPHINVLALAWMCKNSPDVVCSVLEAMADPLQGARDFARTFLATGDARNSHLLELADLAENQHCKTALVGYTVMVVAGMIERFPDLGDFCNKHEEIIKQITGPSDRPSRDKVCPSLIDVADLRARLAQLRPSRGYGRLVVRRELPFSDSLSLLLNPFLDSTKPGGVGYVNERGVDQGGVTRDWFTEVGQSITGSCDSDPAGSLFRTFSPADGAPHLVVRSDRVQAPEDLRSWFAFGKLIALSLIRKEQVGVQLPLYFFARFLHGRVEPKDLIPELETRGKNYQNLLTQSVIHFGVTEANPTGNSMIIDFEELPEDEDGTTVTFGNRDAVMARIMATYSSGPDEPAFEQMRSGFSAFLDMQYIRKKISAIELKILVSGEDELDVPKLKLAARRSDDVTPQRFDWLFEWVGNAKVDTQRNFMHFVTGSRSFSIREIRVNGPNGFQGTLPMSHTCQNIIDLPHFISYQQLAEAMNLAVRSSGFVLD